MIPGRIEFFQPTHHSSGQPSWLAWTWLPPTPEVSGRPGQWIARWVWLDYSGVWRHAGWAEQELPADPMLWHPDAGRRHAIKIRKYTGDQIGQAVDLCLTPDEMARFMEDSLRPLERPC